jgi:Regulator of chromosome condensation (RCC1) repeat
VATRSVREAPGRRAVPWPAALGLLLGLALITAAAAYPPFILADEPSSAPTLEELGLPRIASVAQGLTHGCLLGDDGSVWCWGSNHYGELGTGGTSDTYSPVPVRVDGIPDRVRQIEADETSTCALTEVGGVWCWGENTNGEVGDGTTENRSVPTPVTGLGSGVAALAEGEFTNYRCAVLDDGSAACWGENYTGQLGDGTTDKRLRPVRVSVIDDRLVAIATTLQTTCALTDAGAVRCWGWLWSDPTGKAEEEAAADRAALTPRGLGAGVTDLSIAGETACVVMTGGQARCWRWREPDNDLASQPWSPGPIPAAVAGLPEGIETIHVSHHAWSDASAEGLLTAAWACATRGGDAWCWGGNAAGQLGDGTTTDRPQPVEVQTDDITELSVEWGTALALLGDGSLVTWGNDDPAPRSPFSFPFQPAPPTTGYRPPDTLVPTITTQIPTPADISTDPPVVGANLLLAAFAMILFTISTEILNRNLGQLDPVLVRRFRPIDWVDRARVRLDAALPGRFAGKGHTRLANGLRLVGIVAFYGVVFALLDPTWDPMSITGVWLVVIMAVSFGLVGLSGDIAAWVAARRWGIASDLAVKPGSLVTAVGSTLFTRALVLVPGVMIGSPEALDIDAEHTDRRRLGGLAGVGLGTVLIIGLLAWLTTLATTALQGGGEIMDDLAGGLGAFLLLVFAAAVQNGFVQLLSLRESAGLALRRTHRIPWAIALLVVTFLFWHTLVNPRGDLAEAIGSTNVQAFLITVGIVFAAAVIVGVASMVTRRTVAAGAESIEPPAITVQPIPAPVAEPIAPGVPVAPVAWSEPVPVPAPPLGAPPPAPPAPRSSGIPIGSPATLQPSPVPPTGTYEATAVTRRQWVGIHLAVLSLAVMGVWAFVASLELLTGVYGSARAGASEMQLFLTTWSFVHRDTYPPVIGYAFPPVTLWIGLAALFVGTSGMTVQPVDAIRRAGAGMVRRRRLISIASRADRDAGRNLVRRLHERGRAGLFSGGRVRLCIGIVGAGLVLVTALFGPTSLAVSGVSIRDVERGLLPTVCLVGSLIALFGLVLSFPYGPRERVIIDASGNVTSGAGAVVPPAVPPPLQSTTPSAEPVWRPPVTAPPQVTVAAPAVAVPAPAVAVSPQPVAVSPHPIVVGASVAVVEPAPAIAPQPPRRVAPPVTDIPPPPPPPPGAPAMAFCPGCGTRRIEGARFCIACSVAFDAFARRS